MNSKHNKLKPTHSIYGSVFWHLVILHHVHLEPIKLGCSLAAEVCIEAGAMLPALVVMRSVQQDNSGGSWVEEAVRALRSLPRYQENLLGEE